MISFLSISDVFFSDHGTLAPFGTFGIVVLFLYGLCKFQTMERHQNRRHLPLPKGPYPVGCVDIMTEYSINGCFMRLFYPAENGALKRSMQWPLWLPSKNYLDGYAKFIKMWPPLMRTIHRFLVGDVYVPAIWNAYPIRGMKFPMLVFSHGLGGCRTTYSTICIELASQGFIVAAVEHRDGSACLSYYLQEINPVFNDNEASASLTLEDVSSTYVPEFIQYERLQKHQKEYPLRNKQVHKRAAECQKALDMLIAINNGVFVNNLAETNFSGSHFENIMDVSRIAMVGHSFGGATLIQTLTEDPRFSVGVALDPWMFPLKDEKRCYEQLSQPILFINTEGFQTAVNSERLQRLFSDEFDRSVITIRGTVHQNQSDVPFLSGKSFIRRFLGAHSSLNPNLAMDINNNLTLQYLWKHLDIPSNKDYDKFLEDNSIHLIRGLVVKSNL